MSNSNSLCPRYTDRRISKCLFARLNVISSLFIERASSKEHIVLGGYWESREGAWLCSIYWESRQGVWQVYLGEKLYVTAPSRILLKFGYLGPSLFLNSDFLFSSLLLSSSPSIHPSIQPSIYPSNHPFIHSSILFLFLSHSHIVSTVSLNSL